MEIADNSINDEVNKSYLQGKITLYEIDKLIKSICIHKRSDLWYLL